MLEHIEKDGTVFTAKLRRLKGINSEDAFTPLASSTSLLD
jgi:hypothetical protein